MHLAQLWVWTRQKALIIHLIRAFLAVPVGFEAGAPTCIRSLKVALATIQLGYDIVGCVLDLVRLWPNRGQGNGGQDLAEASKLDAVTDGRRPDSVRSGR